MLDIWSFLLQTLTASGVAVLILVIKALFKDKLPPKWHFLVWSSLGFVLLLPAGLFGRYTLFRWQLVIEIIKAWFKDYSFTRVLFPIPILTSVPETFLDWVFAIYTLGVVVFAAKYIASYIRLRLILRKGMVVKNEKLTRIQQIADEHNIRLCKVIELPGLPSAFTCGVIRPILALPSDSEPDDKVILHELFHLRHKDTLWSIVICMLRCIHWCNPLLIYCANRAINDMESRCDQYVLESTRGEERRDYGRILLSMSNERYAKTAGSTCINNGGKNIRNRIEAIARFKKYPVGMGLVSACIIIVLTLSLTIGAQASKVYDLSSPFQIALASARSTPCTTLAGAFDAYAKSVLTQSRAYRAMCAPSSMQAEIADSIKQHGADLDCIINARPDAQSGYYIYNLKPCEKNVYEGMLVIKVGYLSDGQTEEEDESEETKIYLAYQTLRVQKEDGRWVAVALDDFRYMPAYQQNLQWGYPELPGLMYSGVTADFRIDNKIQTVYIVDNWVNTVNNYIFNHLTVFNTTPNPHAKFSSAYITTESSCTHLGTQEERNEINRIGLSVIPVYPGGKRSNDLSIMAGSGYWSSTNSMGESKASSDVLPGWGPTVSMGGGGTDAYGVRKIRLPEYCDAGLYINGELVSQIDLYLQEEVAE